MASSSEVRTCDLGEESKIFLIIYFSNETFANISLFYYKLTLILGARCIDGVVIVGDSKITDVMGTLLRYEPKYAGALCNVLFGYSGVVHMFKVFERYVVGDVVILRDSKDKYTPENLLEKISDAMHVLFEARSNQYFDLRVMVKRHKDYSFTKSFCFPFIISKKFFVPTTALIPST